MYKYSKRSLKNLSECHPLLIALFMEVIKHVDCTIIDGYRTKKEQNDAFNKGYSKLKYPKSKHNKKPSLAADVMPYPIDWDDAMGAEHFAGIVKGIAFAMGIPITWGGDWRSFIDRPHYQLNGSKEELDAIYDALSVDLRLV